MGYYYSAYTNKPKIKSKPNNLGYYEIDDEFSQHSFLAEKRSSYCFFLILEHLNLRKQYDGTEGRNSFVGSFFTLEELDALIIYIKEDIIQGTKKPDEIERWKSINSRGDYPVEKAIESDIEYFKEVVKLAKEKYCHKVFITFD